MKNALLLNMVADNMGTLIILIIVIFVTILTLMLIFESHKDIEKRQAQEEKKEEENRRIEEALKRSEQRINEVRERIKFVTQNFEQKRINEEVEEMINALKGIEREIKRTADLPRLNELKSSMLKILYKLIDQKELYVNAPSLPENLEDLPARVSLLLNYQLGELINDKYEEYCNKIGAISIASMKEHYYKDTCKLIDEYLIALDLSGENAKEIMKEAATQRKEMERLLLLKEEG